MIFVISFFLQIPFFYKPASNLCPFVRYRPTIFFRPSHIQTGLCHLFMTRLVSPLHSVKICITLTLNWDGFFDPVLSVCCILIQSDSFNKKRWTDFPALHTKDGTPTLFCAANTWSHITGRTDAHPAKTQTRTVQTPHLRERSALSVYSFKQGQVCSNL